MKPCRDHDRCIPLPTPRGTERPVNWSSSATVSTEDLSCDHDQSITSHISSDLSLTSLNRSEHMMCPPFSNEGTTPSIEELHRIDREIALKLQQEEAQGDDCDVYAQAELSRQESLARRLQNEEYLAFNLRVQERLDRSASAEMVQSHTGKAWKFVEQVYRLHRTKKYIDGVEPVGIDDMVFLAENMFQAQEKFRKIGLPCNVDIGYHYTRPENMSRIQTDGLLSKAERNANGIQSNFNGEAYGPGIYTGNDPDSFCVYGKVGLIVAPLKGL